MCMCARKLRRHQCGKGPPGDDGAHPGWQSPAHACSRLRATSKQLIYSNFKLNCNIVKHYLRAIWGGVLLPVATLPWQQKQQHNTVFDAERQHKQMGGPSWLNTTQHEHPKPRYSHSHEQACSATMHGKRPNLLPTAHLGTDTHNTTRKNAAKLDSSAMGSCQIGPVTNIMSTKLVGNMQHTHHHGGPPQNPPSEVHTNIKYLTAPVTVLAATTVVVACTQGV
jgi:hypothetical protein